jgi:hypothetical protein
MAGAARPRAPTLAAGLRSALNLLERVWGYVKDELSCHCWWADQAAWEAATAHLLSRLQARFHQPDSGGIALVRNFCQTA